MRYVYPENIEKCEFCHALDSIGQAIKSSFIWYHFLWVILQPKIYSQLKISGQRNVSLMRYGSQQKSEKMSFFDDSALRKI